MPSDANVRLPPRPAYTEEQEGTWQILWSRQAANLEKYACSAALDGLQKAGFRGDQIASLQSLSANLHRHTGWRLTRVDGLVAERPFFDLVAQRIFPCTDFIRDRANLDYTPAPDLFHDQFGHLPLLTLPVYARFFERFGEAGRRATSQQVVALSRIYWFTVEFGLVVEDGKRKAFGAGLMSSIGELQHAMSSAARIHPLDLDAIAARPFVTTEIQSDYFEAAGFDDIHAAFEAWGRREGLLGDP